MASGVDVVSHPIVITAYYDATAYGLGFDTFKYTTTMEKPEVHFYVKLTTQGGKTGCRKFKAEV